MDLELILEIVGIVLFIATLFFGGFAIKLSKALKESGELLTVIGTAIEDGSITTEEVAQIFKEAKDVQDAICKILGKE